MANYISCGITFKISSVKFKKMLEELKASTPLEQDREFSLCWVIPEPMEITEGKEYFCDPKEEQIMPLEDRPWFNWYKFHLDKWGTSRDCFSECVSIKDKSISFMTCWSAPRGIFRELTKRFPDVSFKAEFASEDIGSETGVITYNSETSLYTEGVYTRPTIVAKKMNFVYREGSLDGWYEYVNEVGWENL